VVDGQADLVVEEVLVKVSQLNLKLLTFFKIVISINFFVVSCQNRFKGAGGQTKIQTYLINCIGCYPPNILK